eukprot:3638620-Rhodomonas_salina.2
MYLILPPFSPPLPWYSSARPFPHAHCKKPCVAYAQSVVVPHSERYKSCSTRPLAPVQTSRTEAQIIAYGCSGRVSGAVRYPGGCGELLHEQPVHPQPGTPLPSAATLPRAAVHRTQY